MRIKKLIFLLLLSVLTLSVNAQDISTQIVLLKSRIKQTSSSAIKAQYLIKLGNLYQQIDSVNQAINAFEQALGLITNSRNYSILYQLNSFLGVLYSEKKNYAQAEHYFSAALKYANKLRGKRRISQALLNLGNAYRQQGKYKQAIDTYEQARSLAFALNDLQILKQLYTYIALSYKALGDNRHYMSYFDMSVTLDKKIKEQIIKNKEEEVRKQHEIAQQQQLMLALQRAHMKNMHDSLQQVKLQNEQNKMRIALLEKESQLKELQMKQREAELKKKEAEQRVSRIIIISLLVFILIIFAAGLIVYKQYLLIKKKNKELDDLNQKLALAYGELEEKHKVIKKQNKQIQDSIKYASRIQRAILPSMSAIIENFPEGEFIFYLPRDVVSGDFYWFSDQGKYKFLALVDCTGHSVPGAFMSMIGNTLLNEIVNSNRIFDPSVVLLELHNNLIKLLHTNNDEHQKNGKEKKYEIYDGMDIALLRFEADKDELAFASANQPLFLVYQDGRLEEIDGDIFSIGGYFGKFKVHFKNIIIPLEEHTNIYLTSDGYFDQFNGETKEKFTRKRFTDLLQRIYTLPFNLQQKEVTNTFTEWKGDYRQIDDVLVIGLHYSSKGMKPQKNNNNE